jgi:hypothetical protein
LVSVRLRPLVSRGVRVLHPKAHVRLHNVAGSNQQRSGTQDTNEHGQILDHPLCLTPCTHLVSSGGTCGSYRLAWAM